MIISRLLSFKFCLTRSSAETLIVQNLGVKIFVFSSVSY